MQNVLDEKIVNLAMKADKALIPVFDKLDEVCEVNSRKVIEAFIKNRVSSGDFTDINGYGYYDGGRDKLEKIFAEVLGGEDALVRPHIMSGTNAIALVLSALLHHGDTMLSISGLPYDSLRGIIGLTGNSTQSLMRNGVLYEQIDLVNNDFDYDKIEARIKKGGVTVVAIQRSRGYSDRKSLTIAQHEKVIKKIKDIDKNVIVMVDNCYGELVETKEPTEVGADIIVGSLMKNLGGGIASSGGYVVGKTELIEQVAERLTAPGIGKSLGANFNQNLQFFKGLYMAPSAVKNALKTAVFTAWMLKNLGFEGIDPAFDEFRTDIIQTVSLKNEENLVKFCQGMQKGSPVDSFATVEPGEMPGYPHDEVMAAGTFTQGSTIELSCDAPVTEPYTAYMQGGLTYEYGKYGVLVALSEMVKGK
ncbi:MAG: aminotransferase class I/II-fold pyridoxal phosphate-dependent enzyme [Clostridia bacterium]|nr:aminotransferase class I/II-fold pyridoxal phosphate-dependent enzyme [Clostridia bacterium]